VKEPAPLILVLAPPVIEDRGTHAKVFYAPSWGLRVTFGGLNAAGHYQPLRGDDTFTFLHFPFDQFPAAREVYDGAGWRIRLLTHLIETSNDHTFLGLEIELE
jgi:hypothetical protein